MTDLTLPETVEHWPIEKLRPYAKNARTHSDAQIDQIAASMLEFGWTNPILASSDGTVIAGHGRLEAAKRIGSVAVPVLVLQHLSDAQRRAYILADNKLALNAGWDDAILAEEIAALAADGFDVPLIGFSDEELDDLLEERTEGETDPDETPEPPKVPVTQLGDVWILGRHRIICGSSTDAETVTKVLNGVEPHLMVTDPPYGVDYDADWRNKAMRPDGSPYGASAIGKVANDSESDWREAWALFSGDVAYVWHAGLFAATVAESLQAEGFKLRSQIIWAESNFAIGRGDYHWHHEPCWYAVREGKTGHYAGDRKQTTLWQIPKPARSETGHSTQKPIECMKRPIENNSSPGQAVYEPFCGSGTTIIAGEMTGRHVYVIELNPVYVDVSVIRWQMFAGDEARLEATGQTFAEVQAARGAKVEAA